MTAGSTLAAAALAFIVDRARQRTRPHGEEEAE